MDLPKCDCAGENPCPIHGAIKGPSTRRKLRKAIQQGRLTEAQYAAWCEQHGLKKHRSYGHDR